MTYDRGMSDDEPVNHPTLKAPVFHDRVLTEAARLEEELPHRWPGELVERAGKLAQADGLDDETALIRRAQHLPGHSHRLKALDQLRQGTSLLIVAVVLLSILVGAMAGRATLAGPRDEPINIFWLIGAILGGQTIFLLAWLVLAFLGPGALLSGSLGGFVMRVIGWLFSRRSNTSAASVAMAWLGLTTRGAVGRWTFASISHGWWLGFNVGCMAMVVFVLGTRQFSFSWESTIFSATTYQRVTEFIAIGPRSFGVETPRSEQIAASQFDPTDPAAFPVQSSEERAAWSNLLIGSLLLYGLLPRLLLTGASLGLRRRAVRLVRLDLTLPTYIAARHHLRRITAQQGGSDDPASTDEPRTSTRGRDSVRPVGRPMWLTLESESVNAPFGRHDGVVELGRVDGRESEQRVLALLRDGESEPSPLIVCCDLRTTPDRGVRRFLADATAALQQPPQLVLTGGEALRQRLDAEGVRSRVGQWRHAAEIVGIPAEHVSEIDLDKLTAATRRQLRRLLSGTDVAEMNNDVPSHWREAFALLRASVPGWSENVTLSSHTALQQRIQSLYRDHPTQPFGSALAQLSSPEALKERLHDAAQQGLTWLPARLRKDPTWLAAGMLAGAAGCVAAAMIVAPAAVGALPIWAILGGTLTALLPTGAGRHADTQISPDEIPWPTALRAAVVTIVVHELQGHGEAQIADAVDAVATVCPENPDTDRHVLLDRIETELSRKFTELVR